MSGPQRRFDPDGWFDALAGRRSLDNGEGDAAAGVAEGLLLREALRRWPDPAPAADAVADRTRLAALLAAARAADRSATPHGCRACKAIARWLSWPRLAGATAFVAAAWMTVALGPWSTSGIATQPAPGSADTLRGAGAEGVHRLRAADPRALRDRIVDELAQVGVSAARYERLGRFGLDAELPLVRPEGLSRLLARYGVVVPASGGLVIEIEAEP